MNVKLKKTIHLAIVLLISLTFIRCQQDENPTPNLSPKLLSAKNWFDDYQSKTTFNDLFKNQEYAWENAKLETLENGQNAIVIPVNDIKQVKDYKGKKILYLYPLEGHKSFEVTLYELLPTKESLQELNSLKELSHFDGYIVAWNLEKGFIESTKFENSTSIASISGSEILKEKTNDIFSKAEPDPPAASYCLGDVYICNDFQNGGSGYSGSGYVYYVNSGGGSGYTGSYFNSSHGSGGSGGSVSTVTTLPPSCESFNFTSKPGTIWQESAVKNIYLRIILLSNNGVEIVHVISFPQPVLFGAPTNVKIGNTDITPGLAANAAALALRTVMNDVNNKFKLTNTSDMIVEQYFRTQLEKEIPLRIPGGRVQFNSSTSLPATEYKTTAIYSSDCR